MEDRYRALHAEYLEDYNKGRKGKKYSDHMQPEDLDLLENLRSQTIWYPFIYSVPATMIFFGITQVFSLSFLRNPLRKVDSFQTKSNKYTRMVFFLSGAFIIMPLTHSYHWNKYQNARHMVYNRYKPLVDRYVLVRDNLTISNSFK